MEHPGVHITPMLADHGIYGLSVILSLSVNCGNLRRFVIQTTSVLYENVNPIGCFVFPSLNWLFVILKPISEMETTGPLECITESILGRLEPRDVIDFLYQEDALSDEDIELMGVPNTRADRCRLLIKQLHERKNIKAFQVFIRSLQDQYDFLITDVSKHVKLLIHSMNCARTRRQEAGNPNSIVLTPTRHLEKRQSVIRRQKDMCRGMPAPRERWGTFISRVYDHLSMKLNMGKFTQFEADAEALAAQNQPADVRCVVMYLQACHALFQNDTEKSSQLCRKAKELIPKTKNPVAFEVEFMSVVAWRYVKLGKLNKLETVLTGARQTIHSNPSCCGGKVAGWIYVDHVHMLSTMLECANPRRAGALRKEALSKIDLAIQYFDREKGKDGPFGKGFAQIMFASLLLQCGNRMQFANRNITKLDLQNAERLLRKVDNSEIGVPDILKVFYNIAMTDLHFRKGNVKRAIDYASVAASLSATMQMDREHEKASVRLAYFNYMGTKLDTSSLDQSIDSLGSSCSYSKSSECLRQHRAYRIARYQMGNISRNKTWKTHFLLFIGYVRCLALLACVGVGFLIPVV